MIERIVSRGLDALAKFAMYYKTVLKGASKIADECPRDVIIE